MSEEQIWYAVLAAVCTVILIWVLYRKKKKEPQYINVGRSTAILTMVDGTPQTVTRDGFCYGYGYYMLSIYRLYRALEKDWVTTDSGITYNRNQIVSYRVETVELQKLLLD